MSTGEKNMDPQSSKENISLRDWNSEDLGVTVALKVLGPMPVEQVTRTTENRDSGLWSCFRTNNSRLIGHIHTDGSAEDAFINGENGVFVKTQNRGTVTCADATLRKSLNLEAETSALQTAVAYKQDVTLLHNKNPNGEEPLEAATPPQTRGALPSPSNASECKGVT